jgi:hypothetical protein
VSDRSLPTGDRLEPLQRPQERFKPKERPLVSNEALDRFLAAWERYKATGQTDPEPEHGDAWEPPE